MAPTAAADPSVDKFGGWNYLVDNGGQVITIWKISDLKPSTDAIPGYRLAGKLYFDVTGPAPTQAVYNNGVDDLLVWK